MNSNMKQLEYLTDPHRIATLIKSFDEKKNIYTTDGMKTHVYDQIDTMLELEKKQKDLFFTKKDYSLLKIPGYSHLQPMKRLPQKFPTYEEQQDYLNHLSNYIVQEIKKLKTRSILLEKSNEDLMDKYMKNVITMVHGKEIKIDDQGKVSLE